MPNPVERNEVRAELLPGDVGVIGLGVLGRIYAGHLLGGIGERRLRVFDVAPAGVEAAVELGATASASAADVAANVDAMVLSLPAPDAVVAAMTGPDGILAGARPGLLVIDASTIDPATCREMHAHAKSAGVRYLEAPISGGAPHQAGTEGAKAASVSFMCAGEEADFEAAKPYLALLGKRFFIVGPAGAGATVKLISNLCAGLHNLVCAEAFMLGKAAGFDPETLLAVFDGTDARSYHMTDYFALRAASGDFAPGFSIRLQHKDHRLAGELGRALGVPLYLNSLAQEMYQSMIAAGAAGRDLCAAVNLLGRAAGVGEVVPERASA